MIELRATAESVEQAKELITLGVDTVYVGEDEYGLRLPASLSLEEIKEITEFAHRQQKKVCVVVNAIFHNDRIETVVPYLKSLEEIGADSITVGDPGVIRLMARHEIRIPYVYDAHTIVTNARQVNFWAKRGAIGAVLARELTFGEIKAIQSQVTVPVEVQVYGATCIHHSKRPLVGNYLNFTKQERNPERELYISERKASDAHYSIYEDAHGTHIFAADDLNLMPYLGDLSEAGVAWWKLDGIFTGGDCFVSIARLFAEARQAIQEGRWTTERMESLNRQLITLHPKERSLSEGFFLKNAADVQ